MEEAEGDARDQHELDGPEAALQAVEQDAAEGDLLEDAGEDGEEDEHLPDRDVRAERLGHRFDPLLRNRHRQAGEADDAVGEHQTRGGADQDAEPGRGRGVAQGQRLAHGQPVAGDHQPRRGAEDGHVDHDQQTAVEAAADVQLPDQEQGPEDGEPARDATREERGPAGEVGGVRVAGRDQLLRRQCAQ